MFRFTVELEKRRAASLQTMFKHEYILYPTNVGFLCSHIHSKCTQVHCFLLFCTRSAYRDRET